VVGGYVIGVIVEALSCRSILRVSVQQEHLHLLLVHQLDVRLCSLVPSVVMVFDLDSMVAFLTALTDVEGASQGLRVLTRSTVVYL